MENGRDAEAVLITGVFGSGKSSVAIEIAAHARGLALRRNLDRAHDILRMLAAIAGANCFSRTRYAAALATRE